MVILTKFGMILAVVALSIAGTSVSTIVSAQNMTGNMTGGQNMTEDINQTGSIAGIHSSKKYILGSDREW
jgi:hypothetical protein